MLVFAAMTGVAAAEPAKLTDAQMDRVAAGAGTIVGPIQTNVQVAVANGVAIAVSVFSGIPNAVAIVTAVNNLGLHR